VALDKLFGGPGDLTDTLAVYTDPNAQLHRKRTRSDEPFPSGADIPDVW